MGEIDEYARALNNIEILAQRKFIRLWRDFQGERFENIMDGMSETYKAIIQEYGIQAAAEAVDFLILRRSLDDELRFLPTPQMAEPATDEQILGSLSWAVSDSRYDEVVDQAAMTAKLQGIVNRLVRQPAHGTVIGAVLRDGTGYARVPEPGACSFCLMLASRGAVYSRESVLKAKNKPRYHDHCRCIGIEVKNPQTGEKFGYSDDLPQINKDLFNEWRSANLSLDEADEAVTFPKWKAHIAQLKEEVAAKSKYKQLADVTIPTYKNGDTFTLGGRTFHKPDLKTIIEHAILGTNDDSDPRVQQILGHTYRSLRIQPGTTLLGNDWTDQEFADAIGAVFDEPDLYQIKDSEHGTRVNLIKEVNGVTFRGFFVIGTDGRLKTGSTHPVMGKNVVSIRKGDGKIRYKEKLGTELAKDNIKRGYLEVF